MKKHFIVASAVAITLVAGCASHSNIPSVTSSNNNAPEVFQKNSGSQWVYARLKSVPIAMARWSGSGVWMIRPGGLDHLGWTGLIDRSIGLGLGLRDMAVGPDGNLWLIQKNVSIDKVTPAGVVTKYVVPGSFTEVRGITAGPDDAMWFTDGNGGGRVGRISLDGSSIKEYSLPFSPTYLVTGPDGNIYVTAGDLLRVTTAGVVTRIPTTGFTADVTRGPDGAVWFLEIAPGVVGTVKSDGSITEYPVPTSNPNSNDPGDFVSGPDGIMYVELLSALGRFDVSSRTWLAPVLLPGSQFVWPHHAAVADDGNIWFPGGDSSSNELSVLLLHQIVVTPRSLTLTVGGSATIDASEAGFSPTWTVSSTSPSIASVAPGTNANEFVVTAHAPGSCKIEVQDGKHNFTYVPVTVH